MILVMPVSFLRLGCRILHTAQILTVLLCAGALVPHVQRPLAAQTSNGASQSLASPTDAVLRPGDAVRITVWRQPELSGEFRIAADGTIRHPLYRGVSVAGRPLAVVDQQIGSFLQSWEANPQWIVEPLFLVYVGGEVRQPQLYDLEPEVTVAQAVAMAGGPNDRADLRRVFLVRDGRTSQYNLNDTGSPARRVAVQSGDQIIVPRRHSFIRDTFVPTASVLAAVASIVNIYLRYTR